MNIPKICEQALKAQLVTSGVEEATTFINAWRVSDPRDAAFPQIAVAVSPDAPDGTQTDSFSIFRTLHGQMRCLTLVADDAGRTTVCDLEDKCRAALVAANAARATWQSSLFVGCQLDAIEITDSPIPTVEQLPNEAFVNVVDINFDMLVSVTA
jgi:hypothetical protein